MIQVDRGIPLPKSKVTHSYPWDELQIGDSFLFPPEIDREGAGARASAQAKRRGWKLTTRVTPKGIRCWRTA